MPAYLVGHISVKDNELWQQYLSGVKESLAPFDASVIFRGKLDKVLAGQHEYNLVVVIEFSDQSTLNNWYDSEKYQSLIPIRDKAANALGSHRANYLDNWRKDQKSACFLALGCTFSGRKMHFKVFGHSFLDTHPT